MTEKQDALRALDWLANTSAYPHTEEIMARYEAIRAALTEAPKAENKRLREALKANPAPDSKEGEGL